MTAAHSVREVAESPARAAQSSKSTPATSASLARTDRYGPGHDAVAAPAGLVPRPRRRYRCPLVGRAGLDRARPAGPARPAAAARAARPARPATGAAPARAVLAALGAA